MANRPAKFKQLDVTRAAKATIAAGLPVAEITIDPNGNIVVRTTKSDGDTGLNDWDKR